MIHAIEQLPLDNKEHCGLLIQWYPLGTSSLGILEDSQRGRCPWLSLRALQQLEVGVACSPSGNTYLSSQIGPQVIRYLSITRPKHFQQRLGWGGSVARGIHPSPSFCPHSLLKSYKGVHTPTVGNRQAMTADESYQPRHACLWMLMSKHKIQPDDESWRQNLPQREELERSACEC